MKRLLGENDYDADAPSRTEPDEAPSPPGTITYRIAFSATLSFDAAARVYARYDGPGAGDTCWRGSAGRFHIAYITIPTSRAAALEEQLSEDDDVYGFRREDAP